MREEIARLKGFIQYCDNSDKGIFIAKYTETAFRYKVLNKSLLKKHTYGEYELNYRDWCDVMNTLKSKLDSFEREFKSLGGKSEV